MAGYSNTNRASGTIFKSVFTSKDQAMGGEKKFFISFDLEMTAYNKKVQWSHFSGPVWRWFLSCKGPKILSFLVAQLSPNALSARCFNCSASSLATNSLYCWSLVTSKLYYNWRQTLEWIQLNFNWMRRRTSSWSIFPSCNSRNTLFSIKEDLGVVLSTDSVVIDTFCSPAISTNIKNKKKKK